MKTTSKLNRARLTLALCLGFCIPAAVHAAEPTRWATLEAIHNLENPRNLTRPGPCGELGAYQFRISTWREYTTLPFSLALDRKKSDDVAIRHYEWLKQRLQNAHVRPTPYYIALAWNGGIGAAISGHAPRPAREYAERAANLAAEFAKESMVADAR